MVDVFFQLSNRKRGKWSSPRFLQAYGLASGTVPLPSSDNCTMIAVIEDIRPSICDESLAADIHEANVKLHSGIFDALNSNMFDYAEDSC